MSTASSPNTQSIDWLDRIVVVYLVLPLGIFLVGWCNPWLGTVLVGAVVLLLLPLFGRRATVASPGISLGTVLLCCSVAALWAYVGGIGNFRYANGDWVIRDAVLRDLVVSHWPVGYGEHEGHVTLLRTTVAYFLPAAAMGKLFGFQATLAFLLVWTAAGAALFFLQMITMLPSGRTAIMTTLFVATLFSGMDIVGSLLNGGEYFVSIWHIDTHLEWWAEKYQYSSMTTQFFSVPNHALGCWLFTGLLLRNKRATYEVLPITWVSLILWSPFAVVGTAPFALWRYLESVPTGGYRGGIRLRAWLGAALVAVPLLAYASLDSGGVARGIGSLAPMSIVRVLQFFFLEAGIVGWIAYVLNPSRGAIIALLILLLLPIAYFGPANDLVMRASIPSLVVLAVSICGALISTVESTRSKLLKRVLMVFLCIGAVTPMEEIARSFVKPRWDVRTNVTLVGASCGEYWHHYIAKLDNSIEEHILRPPNALPLGPKSEEWCNAFSN